VIPLGSGYRIKSGMTVWVFHKIIKWHINSKCGYPVRRPVDWLWGFNPMRKIPKADMGFFCNPMPNTGQNITTIGRINSQTTSWPLATKIFFPTAGYCIT
ncbi:MAG: hypothetical protein KJ882_09820, partial [Proteobacteria bacterium]|nr:hypothetical protein [Pseudomonadota bacterium]